MVKDIPFEEIKVGDTASFSKKITEADISDFARISGDCNPVHLDEEFAAGSMFKKRIAHGMLTASFISTVLGTELPGANTIYMSQEVKFLAPVYIGETLTASVEVIEKVEEKRTLKLKTVVTDSAGKMVVDGQARVMKAKPA